ncbi:MAG: hypothetical protein V1644_00715 [Candidatus Micrarchaeota archaeon]
MIVKNLIILGVYIAIALLLIQTGFHMIEKTKTELSLFNAELTRSQACQREATLRKSGGNAVYDNVGECNG